MAFVASGLPILLGGEFNIYDLEVCQLDKATKGEVR